MRTLEEIKKHIKDSGYSPRLVIVQIEENEESLKSIELVMKLSEEVGFNSVHKKYEERFPQGKMIEDLKDLAPWVDGIVIQNPIPEPYEPEKIIEAITFDNRKTLEIDTNEEVVIELFNSVLNNIKK